MKTQSEVRAQVIDLIRLWDWEDDTPDKLSHRDLAIKIEDIYVQFVKDFLIDLEINIISDKINSVINS